MTTKYDKGVIIGKFAPLTTGHINLINNAILECEEVHIIVCHSKQWLARQTQRDQKRLTIDNCKRWLCMTYADMDMIHVHTLDETHIPQYPDGWSEFMKLLMHQFPILQEDDVALYASQLDFDAKFKGYLPDLNYVVVDPRRTAVNITATEIRRNLYEHWDKLPSIVRQHYALNVCVLGAESSGKTTLVKMLAKLFSTSWTEEYGRTFCETVIGDEACLTSRDYEYIAYEHKRLEEESLRHSNKITFTDTNALITNLYHYLQFQEKNAIIEAIEQAEDYDLVLFLEPTVKFVADGLRLGRSRTEDALKWLKQQVAQQKYANKVVTISAPDYRSRYDQAVQAVKDCMKQHGAT